MFLLPLRGSSVSGLYVCVIRLLTYDNSRFGTVVRILARFDSRRVQIFVCNTCLFVLGLSVFYIQYVFIYKANFVSMYLSVI
jgi:hypothetical protein